MTLRDRLIRMLAASLVACIAGIVAAAAQAPAPWELCASRDLQRIDQAIDACTAILAASPGDSEAAATAHGYRGIALFRRTRSPQDREAAIRDLEKAVSAGLNTGMASLFSGYLHLARGQIDRAIADYDEAARRDPQGAPALAGRSAPQKQDRDQAAGDRDRMPAADAARVGALLSRARAAIAREDWRGALPDLDEALRLDSTSSLAAEAFTLRATARYQTSDYAGAIADSNAALKMNPRNEQALKIRSYAHVAQGTASSTKGAESLPSAVMVYVARGPAGSCGEKCEEWLAVEGMLDGEAPRRVIAALDRLGTRKLPVVLDFRGNNNLRSAMSIGKILRGRGFDTTVGQTVAEGCRDLPQPECTTLKRAAAPVKATLIPNRVCDIACLLSFAGGVRRTLPGSTTVVISGMFIPNRIGVAAAAPFREGRYTQYRDLFKVHFSEMGLDPRVAAIMDENYDPPRSTPLSREEALRLRIVTSQ
jgi:tetratricopeptide (TPR) repeat protein